MSSKFNSDPRTPRPPDVCQEPNPGEPSTDDPELLHFLLQIDPESGNPDSTYDNHVFNLYRDDLPGYERWYAREVTPTHETEATLSLELLTNRAELIVTHTDENGQTLTWQWPDIPRPKPENFYLDLPKIPDDQTIRKAKATLYP